MSVLVARGRAQVCTQCARGSIGLWSKRIRDFQFMDYDDHARLISDESLDLSS